MAAQATITLADDEATPVNRAFMPQGVDANGVAWWRYSPDGVQSGYQFLTLNIRKATPQSGAAKVTWKLVIPTLETLSTTGASTGYTAGPSVAFTEISSHEYVLPTRDSTQSRANIRKMTYNLGGTGPYVSSVKDLEGVW
jgi:hypothetical protein